MKLFRIFIAGLILTCALFACGLETSTASVFKREPSDFIHVEGQRLITPDGNDFTIHAIGLGALDREALDKDYKDIADLNLNTVTLTLDYRDLHSSSRAERNIGLGWRHLDQHLALARKHHLYLILQMCGIEGAQFIPLKGKTFDYRIWVEPELQERFLRLWRKIAERYAGETQIIGYGMFCEPVTSGPSKQWSELANKAVSRVRSVDRNHVLFIERVYGEFGTRRELSGIDFSPERSFFPVADSNAVYEFYFFERDEYTHQQAPWREDRDRVLSYPDESFEIVYREALNDRGRVFHWDKEYLDFYLKRQLEFGRTRNVPMFVWAFGLMKNCFRGQGGLQWLRDVVDLFQKQNLNWSYSDYRDDDFGVSDNRDAEAILASLRSTVGRSVKTLETHNPPELNIKARFSSSPVHDSHEPLFSRGLRFVVLPVHGSTGLPR
jgi:endoglucanase